jgi:hypothetical protein
MGFVRTPRGAWIILGIAMALSAALILATAQGESFDIDEIFYLGRLVEDSGRIVQHHSLSLEYLLAPYNGHLQLGGKLIYEATFAVAGSNYVAFELVNIAALCACAGLVFELARRRVGALTALAPCVLLLFLGFAREVLLWPFDMHTLVSLAFGLGALLVLRRDDRKGDILACILITLSIATIEVGIALLVGIAVSVLMQPGRLRRAWIFLIPAALYAAWWIWARHFDQEPGAISLSHVTLIPKTIFYSMATVLGALTGTNPVIPATYITTVTWFGRALAVLALIALALRLKRGAIPRTLWVWLAVIASYWVLMGAAARPPEGSRYVFVGAVGVLLVAAEAMAGRISGRVTASVFVLVALALPANIAQLRSGRENDALHHEAPISRTEFAMIELARGRVDPEYVASADPNVTAIGGGLFIGLPAGAYLRAVERNGSPAFSLNEVRRQPEELRRIADNTLVEALGLRTEYAPAPATRRGCGLVAVGPGTGDASFAMPPGGALLRVSGEHWAGIWLQRFAENIHSASRGRIPPQRWVKLAIPPDGAPDRWRATIGAPVTVCPAAG